MTLVRLSVSLCAAMVLMFASSSASAQTEPTELYSVNQAASSVGFTIYGSMIFKIKRDGQFKDFSGELSYDPQHPGSTHVDLTVYTASVDMHNAEHEQLMKSGEFFDVDHYPTMHFASASAEIKPDGSLAMTGDMTIRGVTRRMTIPVKLRPSTAAGQSEGAVFETSFPIDRTDFGLNGNPGWGGAILKIAKNVQIHISIATTLHAPFTR
ncbi:MAG TPA: YceI family protein [Vicinamibacterales bacterium]|nr:YceI family protein [Vicinamibacterales bacterium]